jgi:hypothetical protein
MYCIATQIENEIMNFVIQAHGEYLSCLYCTHTLCNILIQNIYTWPILTNVTIAQYVSNFFTS